MARFIPETQGLYTFYERVKSLGVTSGKHTPTPPNTQAAISGLQHRSCEITDKVTNKVTSKLSLQVGWGCVLL